MEFVFQFLVVILIKVAIRSLLDLLQGSDDLNRGVTLLPFLGLTLNAVDEYGTLKLQYPLRHSNCSSV